MNRIQIQTLRQTVLSEIFPDAVGIVGVANALLRLGGICLASHRCSPPAPAGPSMPDDGRMVDRRHGLKDLLISLASCPDLTQWEDSDVEDPWTTDLT